MITLLILIDILVFLGVCYAVEYENGLLGWIGTIFVLGLLAFILSINPITFILENVALILVGIVGYFIVGSIWSVFKWNSWLGSNEIQKEIREISKRTGGYDKEYYMNKYRPKQNSWRIIHWINWWPISLLNSLTFKLIHRISSAIYDSIIKLLTSISERQIKKALENDANL